jgi:hypothetical protein
MASLLFCAKGRVMASTIEFDVVMAARMYDDRDPTDRYITWSSYFNANIQASEVINMHWETLRNLGEYPGLDNLHIWLWKSTWVIDIYYHSAPSTWSFVHNLNKLTPERIMVVNETMKPNKVNWEYSGMYISTVQSNMRRNINQLIGQTVFQ